VQKVLLVAVAVVVWWAGLQMLGRLVLGEIKEEEPYLPGRDS
jgi:hypothetical protein